MIYVDMSKRYFHHKLVRDRIPEIIEQHGEEYEARVLGDEEYTKTLKEKLVEEAKEVVGAKYEELPSELADVLQLVQDIAAHAGVPLENIEETRKDKEARNGGFKRRVFLIWSSRPQGEGAK